MGWKSGDLFGRSCMFGNVRVFWGRTTSEYTLPIFLNNSKFDNSLLTAPQTLKDYIALYKHEKEIFDLKERHDIDELDLETSNKNFFTNNIIVDIFVIIIAKLSVMTTMIIIQQLREVSASTTKKEDENYTCNCTSQFYIILALSIAIIGLVIFTILQVRRIKLCSQNNAFCIRCTISCAGKIM